SAGRPRSGRDRFNYRTGLGNGGRGEKNEDCDADRDAQCVESSEVICQCDNSITCKLRRIGGSMKKLVFLSFSLLLAAACASTPRATASATLAPTSGNTASGTVTFAQMKNGMVEVTINLTGVPPGVH